MSIKLQSGRVLKTAKEQNEEKVKALELSLQRSEERREKAKKLHKAQMEELLKREDDFVAHLSDFDHDLAGTCFLISAVLLFIRLRA